MKTNNEKGQSTIEFIFTFIFGVSLILMIFNSAMNYSTGYLVQYATFMASRVYLTADSSLNSTQASLNGSVDKARSTFNNYSLGIFKIPNEAFQINPAGNVQANEYLTVGGRTSFDIAIDPIGKIAGQTKLELSSESFLGKEPVRAECAARTCYGITGRTNCDYLDVTLFDDGC